MRVVRKGCRLTVADICEIQDTDEQFRAPQPASTVVCTKRCHAGPGATRGLAVAARYAHLIGQSFTPAEITRWRRTADAAFTEDCHR